MNTSAPPNNDPTTGLWSVLRDFVAQAFSLFGAPHEIAQRGAALRREHALLLLWLKQCETLLRRLLCLDALALVPSLESGPLTSSRHRPARTRRFHTQDPENSETWRVGFRVCAGAVDHRSSKTQSLREPVKGKATSSTGRFTSTWPAAERLEALLRVLDDPTPHVRRLARWLKRNAGRVRAFTHVPERRYGLTPLEDPIIDATRLIRARKRNPDSS